MKIGTRVVLDRLPTVRENGVSLEVEKSWDRFRGLNGTVVKENVSRGPRAAASSAGTWAMVSGSSRTWRPSRVMGSSLFMMSSMTREWPLREEPVRAR
jgi:hypothetical protein